MLRVMSPSAEVQGHSPAQRVTERGKRNVKIRDLSPSAITRCASPSTTATTRVSIPGAICSSSVARRMSRWGKYLEELAAKGLTRE